MNPVLPLWKCFDVVLHVKTGNHYIILDLDHWIERDGLPGYQYQRLGGSDHRRWTREYGDMHDKFELVGTFAPSSIVRFRFSITGSQTLNNMSIETAENSEGRTAEVRDIQRVDSGVLVAVVFLPYIRRTFPVDLSDLVWQKKQEAT